jgi:PKHD-type hydroxylase
MQNHYNFQSFQNPHFVEYVSYNGLLLPHEIDRILSLWKQEETVQAEVSGASKYKEELRKSSVMHLDYKKDHEWLFERLATAAQKTNAERYGFDLSGFQQGMQLTRYGKGDFFDWHLDFGAGEISDRKLSLTVQLSDPDEYEGGDLEFMINQNVVKAPREKGTVIVFPSFIMHRVTPITKGVRQSIVAWASGPPYR